MTDFGFWQRLVQEQSQGREVMCTLCFEVKPREDMQPTGDGKVWDACKVCWGREHAELLRRLHAVQDPQ